MAVKNVVVCDVCGAEQGVVRATVRFNGDQAWHVDLCPEHRVGLEDFKHIAEAHQPAPRRRRFEVLSSPEDIPTVE